MSHECWWDICFFGSLNTRRLKRICSCSRVGRIRTKLCWAANSWQTSRKYDDNLAFSIWHNTKFIQFRKDVLSASFHCKRLKRVPLTALGQAGDGFAFISQLNFWWWIWSVFMSSFKVWRLRLKMCMDMFEKSRFRQQTEQTLIFTSL